MKLKINKEENINENSKEALKDFKMKQILMNILYHKIFLGMCILFNIGLFIFYIIYRNQLQEIELLTNQYTRDYTKGDAFINEQRSTINHKLVNLISISRRKNILFAYSFANKDEYEMVKNFIIEYYRKNPLQYNENIFERHQLKLIYQSTSDNVNFFNFVDILNYHRNSLFIIHTVENKKFGIYVDEPIIFDDKKEFISRENRLFVFSFQSKTMHKYIGNGNSLKMNKNKLIEVGDNNIYIFENFYNNGGYINYPIKDFEDLNEKEDIFTGSIGKFEIKNIEIFAFYLDMDKLEYIR